MNYLRICGILNFCMIDFYTKSKNIKDDSVYKIKYYTVKTAFNGTARDWNFSPCRQILFITGT
jgi:hypothetical protein